MTIIIDPLELKIHNLLLEGKSYPLNQSQQRYGTEDDVNQLISIISETSIDAKKYIFIDFTPFERIGHLSLLISQIKKIKNKVPVLLFMSSSIINEIFSIEQLINFPIILFSENGEYENFFQNSYNNENILKMIKKEFLDSNGKNLSIGNFRKEATEKKLSSLLFEPGCLDIPYRSDKKDTIRYIAGRYYRVMPNNMLVTCYINLKHIGTNPKYLTKIAYEIILEIVGYFRRDIDMLDTFDVIVTTNNTALMLASVVQAIIEKPVIAIDRLGPIPAIQLQSERLKGILHKKNIIVIEEVVATGNEIDRTVLFLHHLNSEISKVIAVYNLEVGRPLLLDQSKMFSLCKPREELKYVCRSQ